MSFLEGVERERVAEELTPAEVEAKAVLTRILDFLEAKQPRGAVDITNYDLTNPEDVDACSALLSHIGGVKLPSLKNANRPLFYTHEEVAYEDRRGKILLFVTGSEETARWETATVMAYCHPPAADMAAALAIAPSYRD